MGGVAHHNGAMTLARLCLCQGLALLAALVAVQAQPSPQVNTSRQEARPLSVPEATESFHFLIFGDRTGGPPEGVQVLAQAVRDANLLAPDLVMTVGDFVQGYNNAELWHKQMQEFCQVMEGLQAPWFPVAGNHDIYWRGEGRPEREHEADFEKHFGPLWYWFEYKQCGFLVLFTDEGKPGHPEVPRAYNDPTQQQFSPEQLAWLKQELEKMKQLRHVFVFMHHPRWIAETYPGSNWEEVHKLLVAAGNVRACFAGHIHRMRYDGVRDGIEYHALATTGGSHPGDYPGMGYFHHFNMVTVRPQGIKVSTLPVGVVVDPTFYTPERQRDLDSVWRMQPQVLSAPLPIKADGYGTGIYQVKLHNPSQRAVEYVYKAEPHADWVVTPEQARVELAPGASQTLAFTCVRVKGGLGLDSTPPVFALESTYVEDGGRRTPLPVRRFPAEVTFEKLPPEVFAPSDPNAVLRVSGNGSGVRVAHGRFTLPNGPFTLEAWVRPENTQPAGLVAKLQRSGYGLVSDEGRVSFVVHLDGRAVAARSPKPLPAKEWTHVAGVYDGERVVLYLNGQPVAQAEAKGALTDNQLPLYIGADPGAEGQPTRPLNGWVDEVRLSKTVRYTEAFSPECRWEPDEHTVLLYHLDRLVGGQVPDHSPSAVHGVPVGQASLQPAP